MKRGGQWLSKDAEDLAGWEEAEGRPPSFDVVVVGSGYGGAVAAARLSALAGDTSETPMRVCVLERGLEYPAGSFPNSFSDLVGHQRVSGAAALGGQTMAEGLMDWHVGGDVAALVANGVGGGSLINAGVCEPAQDVVLDRPEWPEPWRANRPLWQQLYERASGRLGAVRWPSSRVPKQSAMERVALESDGACRSVSLTITPPAGTAAAPFATSAPMAPCIECGDCFTGCNVGAKRTLSHSYLADAVRQGAALYRGATVLHVVRNTGAGRRWTVRYVLTDATRMPLRSAPFEVQADHVVLAAGTFGSTEILMRSRQRGLALSGRLGEGFSANGDVIAAFYDTLRDVNASPAETDAPEARRTGPTITSQIRWPVKGERGKPVADDVMQELTVPGALGWIFREVVTTMMVPQRWTRPDFSRHTKADRDRYAIDEGAIRRTLLTVTYADDGARGRLEQAPGWAGALRDGSVVVRWGKPAAETWFTDADRRLAGRAPAGSYLLRNPLTQFMPKDDYLGVRQTSSRLLTVHPLGGCRMGEDGNKGVVDAHGRVFDAGVDLSDRGGAEAERLRAVHDQRAANAVHEGLYVLDGSIVPTSLGINPLLTITALAEGAIDQWARDNGWRRVQPVAQALAPAPAIAVRPVAVPSPTAVRFGERMTGKLDAAPGWALTMRARFAPIADLRAFLGRSDKGVALKADFALRPPEPRNAAAPPPGVQQRGFRPKALHGTVRWLEVEPSCVGQRFVRTALTYLTHRFLADRAAPSGLRLSGEVLSSATHFGAVRELAYEFQPLDEDWPRDSPMLLPKGTVLRGRKRVGYFRPDCLDPESRNPWRQLGELPLKAHLPDGREIDVALLKFDEMAMVDRYDLPLKVIAQQDALTAMRDLAGLALYFGRTLFGLHMLSFRRPDYPSEVNGPRAPQRLPPERYEPDPRFDALEVTVHPVRVEPLRTKETIFLRLTRIRRRDLESPGEPVVLIHGFGSGGIQYTHPAIDEPLAPWLAREHREDVWVVELRTSIGLPTAARQWVMDDVASEDIPALIGEVRRLTGRPKVKVVAHCIGSAMFNMALLRGRLFEGNEPIVSAAVMMQVGPHAELPRASRARSYIALRLQQIAGLAKVSSVASQAPTDMESLMDRVLGTFLYPEQQRPFYRLTGDARANARNVNAHRSAGVFGQLFERENMSDAVMDAVEDLLGECNLTTYAQTAQYGFVHRLTDQRGDDVYLKDAQIRRYLDFPVLLLHGDRNRTFDPRTLTRNQALLAPMRQGVSHQLVPGYGHLDCVVGRGAAKAVFPFIARQLAAPSRVPPMPRTPKVDARLHAVGPWLGHASFDSAGALCLRIGYRTDGLSDGMSGVYAVVSGPGLSPRLLTLSPTGAGGGTVDPLKRHEQVVVVEIDAATLDAFLAAAAADPGATLRVAVAAMRGTAPTDASTFLGQIARKAIELRDGSWRRGVPTTAVPDIALGAAWLRRQRDAAPADLGLVLGACRQRPLLVDREMADRTMGHVSRLLGDRSGPADGHAPVDAVILAGDQIYADSRADATHPGSSASRFIDAYREAWSAPWQRDVMRRVPTYMVIDDHEFRNDYNDEVGDARPAEFTAAQLAWSAYQYTAGPGTSRSSGAGKMPPAARVIDTTWADFRLRGFGVFLCDTRAGRTDPPTLDRSDARIMGDEQLDALMQWLEDEQARAPARSKIVVMGSPVAPLIADDDDEPRPLASDGWQRFPTQFHRLLRHIAQKQIGHVLFLAGDYHRFADCELTLCAPGLAEVKARSIVTGGLYAPYPFANACESEWLTSPTRPMDIGDGVTWRYEVMRSEGGDGYTRLTLRDGEAARVVWTVSPPHTGIAADAAHAPA